MRLGHKDGRRRDRRWPETPRGRVRGGPGVFLAEDVLVEVLEELELDRLREPLGRFDAVDDDSTRTPDEPGIEEFDRLPEDPRQVGFPGVPVVRLQVAPGHAPPRSGERVEVVADGPVEVPDAFEVDAPLGGVFLQLPAEERPGVAGVILGVAPAREVADHAATALGEQAPVGPLEAELRLACTGRAGQDGQGAGDEAAAERGVEGVDPEGLPRSAHARCSAGRRNVGDIVSSALGRLQGRTAQASNSLTTCRGRRSGGSRGPRIGT